MRKFLVLFFFLAVLLFNSFSQTGSIRIVISGFRQVEGNILASVFNTSEGFPEESKLCLASMTVELKGTTQTLVFENIPYGKYAVAIVHDRNKNGILDKNFLGIPREGYAVSNNIKGLSPPLFEEACFDLSSEMKVVELNLIYF